METGHLATAAGAAVCQLIRKDPADENVEEKNKTKKGKSIGEIVGPHVRNKWTRDVCVHIADI